MSWNLQVEANYVNASFPYNSAGSFINFFEGLAYEHVNFIFADALHVQESTYPSMHSSFYKFGLSEPGSISYYDHSHDCVFNDHAPALDEYDGHFETSVPMATEQTAHVRTQLEESSGINVNTSHVECPQGNHNAHNYQVAMLSHRAVGGFLSHCGWNSVLEAVTAGVMVLGWPMEADQFVNAKLLVEYLGAGVRVCEGADTVPDPDELAGAIAESMSGDGKMQKKRAKELREEAVEAAREGGPSWLELEDFVRELAKL